MLARSTAIALLVLTGVCGLARADALGDVRHRGHLVCAVNADVDEYSEFDGHGDLSAFETAYCRAVAAAILGDPRRAAIDAAGDEITGLRDLHDGHADMMIGATPDLELGAALHLAYAPPILFDGQGFLAAREIGIRTLADLAGKRICWISNTPATEILTDRLHDRGIDFHPFAFEERGEMEAALATNHCNAVTGDVSELAHIRLSLPGLRSFSILPEKISTDPLSPAVRDGEPRLLAIVTAVGEGLLDAEVSGVTQANAATLARTSHDLRVRRLTGADGWIGPALGLDEHWLLRAIEAVGNHAEIYRRDVGADSRLRLPVGANAPVLSGGALITVPVDVAH